MIMTVFVTKAVISLKKCVTRKATDSRLVPFHRTISLVNERVHSC